MKTPIEFIEILISMHSFPYGTEWHQSKDSGVDLGVLWRGATSGKITFKSIPPAVARKAVDRVEEILKLGIFETSTP